MESGGNGLSQYEKISISMDIVKEFIHENLPGYEIQHVKGDGLCIIHAFSKGYYQLNGCSVPVNEIKETLRNHLVQFKDHYSDFSETHVDIVDELDRIFRNPLKNYDSDTTDLFLTALGNAYDVNIVVFQSNEEKCWIVNLSDTEDPFSETLYFARTVSLHIDPIVLESANQSECNKTDSNPSSFQTNKSSLGKRPFNSKTNTEKVDMNIHVDLIDSDLEIIYDSKMAGENKSSDDSLPNVFKKRFKTEADEKRHEKQTNSKESLEADNETEEEDAGEEDTDGDNADVTSHTNISLEFDFNNPTADSIFSILICNPRKHEKANPPKGIRENTMYTTKYFNEAISDDNGAYLRASTAKKDYFLDINWEKNTILSKTVKKDGDRFFYNERNGRSYSRVYVNTESVYTLVRYYRKNKTFPITMQVVGVIPHNKNKKIDYKCIIYLVDDTEVIDDISILPHGNSKNTTRPYIRTNRETIQLEKDSLNSGKAPTEVYDDILKECGGPLMSSTQSKEPRDMKQIYNLQQSCKGNVNNDKSNKCEITSMVDGMKSLDIVKTIVIKKDCYLIFTATDQQINDIEQFCCSENNASVLGIDTTFNLCDLWVTDSCYRNKRLINPKSGNHPVFLGPAIFHFLKNERTFSRFALELLDCSPALKNIKTIGVDMEDAILNGFRLISPDVKALYCVRHLKQRDEQQIDKMIAKLKCTERERISAKSEILNDIYGERRGSSYEYGLAEASDKDEFVAKLNSLERKWESLCPGYYGWFITNRKQKFIDSVISEAREGTDVASLFYQNDIESMHFVEKKNLCFQKKSALEVAKSLQQLHERQQNEEIRALYGAGSYQLAKTHQQFVVDSARWHSWSPKSRSAHVENFRKFTPKLSNQFKKPKNAGRKPSSTQRIRNDADPEVVTDRLESGNQPEKESSEQTMRFADPMEKTAKSFELHLRKLLPRAVKKCQGNCGKRITPEDEGVLVKTYGTATWTDKTTGKERSKFGPMYVHFQRNCLEAFDSENFYGAGNCFDFTRIKVDKESAKQMNEQEIKFLKNLNVSF